jgi:hypothetical protein
MAQLPDVQCWVKAVLDSNGKVIPNGDTVAAPAKVVVRYVVANDSHKAAGPLTVVGTLRRNGVQVTPPGMTTVVPVQQITVQPDNIWKKEWPVTEEGNYVASILGDYGHGGGFVNEEDEANNLGTTKFSITKLPA